MEHLSYRETIESQKYNQILNSHFNLATVLCEPPIALFE